MDKLSQDVNWHKTCLLGAHVSHLVSSCTTIWWLTEGLIGWLAAWLVDWQRDWLTDWLTNWLTNRLAGCLVRLLTGLQADWLTGWLTGWLTDRGTDWLTNWLTSRLACCLASLLAGLQADTRFKDGKLIWNNGLLFFKVGVINCKNFRNQRGHLWKIAKKLWMFSATYHATDTFPYRRIPLAPGTIQIARFVGYRSLTHGE